ncbi:hypothetical protein DFH07DRAFT_989779 [Mycena maculata]|uniref:Uncharacterized protein n=1 Tax=Mycena maculata TaxID=230809 RepID=A0AAD7MV11_9AGAR|nr:hypothetical protein DFH07DRAFT_989779 [Mycena maculata]
MTRKVAGMRPSVTVCARMRGRAQVEFETVGVGVYVHCAWTVFRTHPLPGRPRWQTSLSCSAPLLPFPRRPSIHPYPHPPPFVSQYSQYATPSSRVTYHPGMCARGTTSPHAGRAGCWGRAREEPKRSSRPTRASRHISDRAGSFSSLPLLSLPSCGVRPVLPSFVDVPAPRQGRPLAHPCIQMAHDADLAPRGSSEAHVKPGPRPAMAPSIMGPANLIKEPVVSTERLRPRIEVPPKLYKSVPLFRMSNATRLAPSHSRVYDPAAPHPHVTRSADTYRLALESRCHAYGRSESSAFMKDDPPTIRT